jgi:hypothetical protein
MLAARLLLTISGIGVLLYGASRLLLQTPPASLLLVGLWLVAAVAIHDGLLSPLVIAVGAGLGRLVPDRGRRFLQFALIAGSLVTVVAVPLIVLRGSQPPSKALLVQDYGAHLSWLLGLIAAGALVAYAVQVARDRTRARQETGSDSV